MCSKRQFDKRGAQTALNNMNTHLKRFANRKEKRIYHCMDCDAWHLTSMDEPSYEIRAVEIENDQFKKYLSQ